MMSKSEALRLDVQVKAKFKKLNDEIESLKASERGAQAKNRELVELVKRRNGEIDELKAQLKQRDEWVSVDEFEKRFSSGLIDTQNIWINYKGRVTEAKYYNGKYIWSNGAIDVAYLSECITAVMPITKPTPPKRSRGSHQQSLNSTYRIKR